MVISVGQSVEELRRVTEVLEENLPRDTSYTTNPTWTDPGSKPDRRRENPATNLLNYGSAQYSGLLMACVINHKGRTEFKKRRCNEPATTAFMCGGTNVVTERTLQSKRNTSPRASVQLSLQPHHIASNAANLVWDIQWNTFTSWPTL
jgi:hypothetical protein